MCGGTRCPRPGTTAPPSARSAVRPCRGGRAPELDNFEQLQQLGRLVARIHLVGATAEFENRPQIDVESYGIASREYLLDEDFIPDEMRDVYASIADLVIDDAGSEVCRQWLARSFQALWRGSLANPHQA